MIHAWLLAHLCLGFDSPTLPEDLSKHDLVRDGSTIVLADEQRIHDELAQLRPQLRKLNELQKKFQAAQDFESRREESITELKREHTQLTDALANLPAGDIARHNQIVVRINQIVALMNRSNPDEQDAIKAARSEYESARASVVKSLRTLLPRVEQLEKTYQTLAQDPLVAKAIEDLPKGAAKATELGPGRDFKADSKDIRKLAKRLESGEILLRNEAGVRMVDVILNDDTHAEFVLDTGAGMLCLPYDLAKKAGAEPTDADPDVQMKIANGDVVQGKLIKMKSVRVGQFEVTDVDCAVLPPFARGVEPLLGNSFLGQFEHQIDPANNKLILSRWGEEKSEKEPASSSRSKRKSRAKRNAETP
jgi:clan AA aspartic protease (TIGR02281 family)